VALYREHPTPPVFWPQVLGFRASVAALAGRFDDALAFLDEAVAISDPRSWDAALVQIQRSDVLAARGDMAAAEAALRGAIEVSSATGGRAGVLMAATRLAGFSTNGRRDAVAALQVLLPTLTEGLDTEQVKQARELVLGTAVAVGDA
jgi:tetratricopeptide (TPR) repeat protein